MIVDQDEINSLKAQAGEKPTDAGGVAVAEPLNAPVGAEKRPRDSQAKSRSMPGEQSAGDGTNEVRRILRIRVPIIAQLGSRKMAIAEIRHLSCGAVIKLDHSADAELSMLINNRVVAYGIGVKINERFGLRITRIGSPQQRILSLGQ